MGRLKRGLLIAALTLAGTAPSAADSMRCGKYLVSTGDTQSRVQDLCGEPQRAWHDGYSDLSSAQPTYPTRPGGYEREIRRVIPVYRWEYNLGRGTFLKTLVFHSDTLVGIIDGPRQ